MWFVELALWDIVGKVAGLPVYRLLGGAHDALPLYASTGQNRTPEQRADDARRLRDEGSRTIKLRIHNETLAEDVAEVRRAVGDDMAIMVDANQTDVYDAPLPGPHWTYHRALDTARALAEYGITWLEEPLPRHAYADLRRLHDASPIPIAGGEVNQQFTERQRLLLDGCYHILQPDVTLCEGLLRVRTIAAMAQAANVLESSAQGCRRSFRRPWRCSAPAGCWSRPETSPTLGTWRSTPPAPLLEERPDPGGRQ